MVFASNADQTGPKQPRNKGFLSGLVQIRQKPGNVIGGKIGGKNAVERWRFIFRSGRQERLVYHIVYQGFHCNNPGIDTLRD